MGNLQSYQCQYKMRKWSQINDLEYHDQCLNHVKNKYTFYCNFHMYHRCEYDTLGRKLCICHNDGNIFEIWLNIIFN